MFCDLSAGESGQVSNSPQSPIFGSRRQSGSSLPLSTSPASSESSEVSACTLACFSVLTSPVELKANSSPVRRKEGCSPTAGPCSHHFETERVEECTRSAWRRRATELLHTPSRLSERCPVPLDDVAQKQRTSQTTTRLEDRHTGMDHGVSRRRRSRLGDAVKIVYCGSFTSVLSNKLAVRLYVSAKKDQTWSFQFRRDY